MMEAHRRSRVVVSLLALAPVLLVAGGPQKPQPPVIRTGITVVPIDVRVVDAKGHPVTDLKRDDFTILEDGRPQAIQHFSAHAFTPDTAAVAGEPAFRRADAPSLAVHNRRVFLVMIGRGRHQVVSKYLDALERFVDAALLPQDQVAVIAWNRATDFTIEHALIKGTVQRIRERHEAIETDLNEWFQGLVGSYGTGEIPPHIQKEIDAAFAGAAALRPRELTPGQIVHSSRLQEELARTLTDLFSRRTSRSQLAASGMAEAFDREFDGFVSTQKALEHDLGNLLAGIEYLRHVEGEKHFVVLTEHGLSLPDQEQHAGLAAAAADGRIAMSFIHTGGALPAYPMSKGTINFDVPGVFDNAFKQTFTMQDLRLMARMTGGQLAAFRTGASAFAGLERTTRFQYLLGYAPSNAARDGRFRTVIVKVNRRGVQVLSRQGYYASEQIVPLDRRQFVTYSRIQAAARYDRVVDHIRVTLGAPAVEPRAVTVPVTFEISRIAFTRDGERHVGRVDLTVYGGDERKRETGEVWTHVDLNLSPESYAKALKDGMTVPIRVTTKARARHVKAVVYDFASDLAGSAVLRLK